MDILFNRNAALSFGLKGEQGKKITGLRITFDIEKTSESTPNTGKIAVYNLSADSWSIVEKKNVNLICILEIGYGENPLKILCQGDINKATRTRQGADIVTTFEIGDGQQECRDAKIDKAYAAGTDIKTVIKDVISSLQGAGKLAIGTIGALKTQIAQQGLSISGTSKIILDRLIAKQGLEWSIQDGEIQVLEPTGNTGEEAFLLNKSTGLIGCPVRKDNGMEFTSLIVSASLKPGRLVKIESKDLNGTYKISKIKYQGDTHGNQWYCNGECISV